MSDVTYWKKAPYAVMIGVVAALALVRPYHNADMVAYIGSAIRSNDFEEIYTRTYTTLKASVPPHHFDELTVSYSADQGVNAIRFGEIIPFYSIKPIYVLAVQVLHFFGIPFVLATVLISVLSYIGVAWLLWKWIGWLAYVVVIGPPLIGLVRYSTPDGLNLLLAMLAFWLICERRSYFWGSTILLVCVWCRTDMVILSGLVFFSLWLIKKIDVAEFGVLSALALASYWFINHLAGSFGWATLFAYSFLGGGAFTPPGEAIIHVTPKIYITTAFENLHALELLAYTNIGLIQSGLFLFVLFAVLAIRFQEDQVYRTLTLASLTAMVVHFLCLPSPDFRYYAPMCLFQTVSFICSVKPLEGKISWPGWKAAMRAST